MKVVATHVALVALLAIAAPIHAQGPPPPAGTPASARPAMLRDVAFEQRLNVLLPLDLAFRDERGREVRLGDYFGPRPVVLALVYYECPMLCTQVLNGLTSALEVLPLEIGRDFTVVTVSFDPQETPALAAAKKRTYMERYRRPGAAAGWHFLTGGEASIRRLTDAVGFRYAYDERIDQFAHAAGITVLTPEGRLARYFYGIEYPPRDLRFALVEAAQHKIGSPVDRLLLFCYHYDPTTGKYGLMTMRLVRAGGLATIAALSGFILMMNWKEKKSSR